MVFNGVLEHLPEPAVAMREFEKRLLRNGLAVLNLPRSTGFIHRLARRVEACGVRGPFERLWRKSFPSPRLTRFDPDTLQQPVRTETTLDRVSRFRLPQSTVPVRALASA